MISVSLKKEIVVNKAVCGAIGVAAFVVMTALSAFVRIPLPFTPVPITLQTFFVLLSGAVLGSQLGAISQLTYLFLGIYGVPVFSLATPSGLFLIGPTAGYLIGFIFAPVVVGRALKICGNNWLRVFAIFYLADFILLGCGSLWLSLVYKLSFGQAFLQGFLPFAIVDLFKVSLATGLYLSFSKRISQIF